MSRTKEISFLFHMVFFSTKYRQHKLPHHRSRRHRQHAIRVLETHRIKQFFLAASCYSFRSYLSCSIVLFITNCTRFLGSALWRVILLRFDASKIKPKVHANAICESIFCRGARVIIRSTLRKFRITVLVNR